VSSLGRLSFLVAVPTVALGGLLSPAISLGCIAKESTEAERFARADVVFTGVAGESTQVPGTGVGAFASTFQLEEVTKGSLTGSPTVLSQASSCSMRFLPGRRYAVFAQRTPSGTLETTLADGNRELDADEPAPRYARTGMTVAAARRFLAFPLYWVGTTFGGEPLTQINRSGAFVGFTYGSCRAETQGCAPPLQIQIVRMCRATIRVAPFSRRHIRRGVTAGSRGGAIVLLTGRQEIRVFGAGGGIGRDAIRRLQRITEQPVPQRAGQHLPATLPGSERGRMPCETTPTGRS